MDETEVLYFSTCVSIYTMPISKNPPEKLVEERARNM